MNEFLTVALPALVTALGGGLLAIRQYQSGRAADIRAKKEVERAAFTEIIDQKQEEYQVMTERFTALERRVAELTSEVHTLRGDLDRRDLTAETWDFYARDLEDRIRALGGVPPGLPSRLRADRASRDTKTNPAD